MHKHLLLGMLLLLVPLSAQADMHTAIDSASSYPVTELQRTAIAGGVAHYSAVIKIGSGTHDKIRLHRITKENAAWVNKPTPYSVFSAHGDTIGAKPSFLVGPDGTLSTSIAVEMAKANIDVWLIDQRWTLVPLAAIDPNSPTADDFMASWGLNRQIADTQIGMAIARGVRAITGNNANPMPFFGYSSGGITGFALAEHEATLPAWARSVKGLLILDVAYKTDDPTFAATICGIADGMDAQIASGVYVDPGGITVVTVGNLAEADPNGASPLLPGATNRQAALFVGTATHALQPYLPHYHFIGGEFVGGFPVDTLFTDLDVFIDVTQLASPYEPLPLMRDMRRNICADTQWDDNFGDIEVPVLGVYAEGGFGSIGLHTLTLLGSYPHDVDSIVISETGDPFTDFGHDDVVRSPLAKALWWNAAVSFVKSL